MWAYHVSLPRCRATATVARALPSQTVSTLDLLNVPREFTSFCWNFHRPL